MDFDTSNSIEFEISQGKRIGRLVLYVVLTLACVFILWIEYHGMNKGSSKAPVAVIGLIYGLSNMFAAIKRLIKINKLSIGHGPDGLFDKCICKYPIPWSEINNISTWEQHRNSTMMLEITKSFEEAQINTVNHFISKLANRFHVARGCCMDPRDLHVGYATSPKIVRAYAKAHNCPALRS